jgi:hypothetical protein
LNSGSPGTGPKKTDIQILITFNEEGETMGLPTPHTYDINLSTSEIYLKIRKATPMRGDNPKKLSESKGLN